MFPEELAESLLKPETVQIELIRWLQDLNKWWLDDLMAALTSYQKK